MTERRMKTYVALNLIAILAMAGCASVGGTMNRPLNEGDYRIWEAPADEVRKAAYQAMVGSGLRMDETDEVSPGVWMLLATRQSGGWTYGEIVRIVVKTEDDEHTRVTVLTRKRAAINVSAKGNYSDEVFDQISFQIGEPVSVSKRDPCLIRGTWKPKDCG